MRIFKCMKCGNIVVAVKNGNTPVCCGDDMKELIANCVDAAVEKHVPVVGFNGNEVTVTCGEVLHPMEEKHYIEFMILETTKGFNIKYLKPLDEPVCKFLLASDEQFVSAYAYCNLHGFWKNKD